MISRQSVLYLILVVLALLGLFVGAAGLSVSEVWEGLLGGLGLADGDRLTSGVIIDIRLPRILGGVLIGVALAVGGVGLQGVTRNRLADPYLLGISSAAGLGFLFGTLATPAGSVPIVPVTGAAIAGALVALLPRRWSSLAMFDDGLILIGVAFNFVFLAWTLIMIFAADSPRLPTFAYFVFGSLGTVTWPVFWVALPGIAIAVGIVARMGRSLDLMSIGDDDARGLGIDVSRVAAFVLPATGAAVGASVAVAGVVGFVGLVAPLLARRLVGPAHRSLMPAAAALGAIFVLASDTLIRGLFGQVEVPLGVVTAAIGGPVLMGMLLRKRWA